MFSMSKLKKRFSSENQTTIFDLIQSFHEAIINSKPPGSFDIDRQFRESISESLKRCSLSRYQVAARMSELVGYEITKSMLDSWTAESKESHRFPAIYLPAFCESVRDYTPLKILGQLVGVFVMPGPEALRAEIKRIEEEISKKRCEKKKKAYFFEGNGGGSMKPEIICDRTLDWFARMMNSPWTGIGCMAVIGIAAIYFGLIALNALMR